MSAIDLTAAEQAGVAAADSLMDQGAAAGMRNPNTSTNTPALPGYAASANVRGIDYRPVARSPFKYAWVALVRALTSFAEDWSAPTLLNSWVNTDASTYNAAGYYKDPLGVVHLRGNVKNGLPAPIFTLPIGYRPSKTVVFASTSAGAYADVSVDSSGSVTQGTGSTSGLSLEGIHFRP